MKNKFFLVAILTNLLFFLSSAQGDTFDWAKIIGGETEKINACKSIFDNDGNIYTIGNFNGTVDFDNGPYVHNLTSTGYKDAFVLKSTPNGDYLWVKTFGESNRIDSLISITLNKQNEILLTGIRRTYNDSLSIYRISTTFFKLTQNGQETWNKSIKTNLTNPYFYESKNLRHLTDHEGNIFLVGYFTGTVDFDPNPDAVFSLSSLDDEDPFILKLDKSGNFIWVKSFVGHVYLESFALDLNNNIIVVGNYSGEVDFDPGNIVQNLTSSNNTGFLLSFSENGELLKVNELKGATIKFINIAENGVRYIVGDFKGIVDFDLGIDEHFLTSSSNAGYVLKLDSLGKFIWARSFPISSYEIEQIFVDKNNDLSLVCSLSGTRNIDNFNIIPSGVDAFIIKLNSDNLVNSIQQIGGIDSWITHYSVSIDCDGNSILTGEFTGTIDCDPSENEFNLTSDFQRWGYLQSFFVKLTKSANFKAVVFNDINGNGIKEENELGVSEQIIQIDTNFRINENNGYFSNILTDGKHLVVYHAPENWKLTTDSTFTINVPNDGDTLYFGIKAIENRPDLKVNVTSGPTRSNFSANYRVNYKNVGSVTESGTVEVVLDSAVAFESSVPTASSIDGQKLRFDFTDLGVNERKQIRITAKMPNVEFLGDTLPTLVSISPIALDVDSLNNRDTLRSVLTGSYDPNDKAVQQGVLDENYVLFGEKLNYTIRFQNTGNDTAFNVNIKDTISSNMDLSSFELIGSSHPCKLEVKGTNTMVFHFYDILLPDSNVNEIGSHGYVQYSIQPKKGLAENTKVNNTGYIYFDYNPAIVTNTTLNTYVSEIPKTGTNGISFIPANQKVSVYPNPTEGSFTINLGSVHEKALVQLTDLQGREIKTIKSVSSQYIPFTINEKPGIYLIQVRSEKGSEVVKVVVK